MAMEKWIEKFWNDHEFSKYLRENGGEWYSKDIGENTVTFHAENGSVIGYAIYDNVNCVYRPFIERKRQEGDANK